MSTTMQGKLKSIRTGGSFSLVLLTVLMVVLLIVFEIIRPGFVSSTSRMGNMLRQITFIGFCSIGQTLVMLEGGIDMSVSSMIMVSNVMASQMMNGSNANIPKTIIVLLILSIGAGLFSGFMIYYLKIPALVATLSTGSILQAIAYIYTDGMPKGKIAPSISAFVNTSYGYLNGPIILFAIVSVVIIVMLRKTIFGRQIYLVGANPVAARTSGINSGRITLLTYCIASVLTMVAGVLLCGYTKTGILSSGATYTMDTITAVVLGGTLVTGGKGGFGGTIVGLVIYTSLASFMTMLGCSEGLRSIIQGIIVMILLLTVNRGNE